jgi:hypothetical protein
MTTLISVFLKEGGIPAARCRFSLIAARLNARHAV